MYIVVMDNANVRLDVLNATREQVISVGIEEYLLSQGYDLSNITWMIFGDCIRIVYQVRGKKMHLILGKSVGEWKRRYGADLWDIPFEEFADGTMEVNEHIWYWYINGRCYETV